MSNQTTFRIPKNPVNFKIQLSDEQKKAKEKVLDSTISILTGVAGTSKTFLACQIALSLHFGNRNEFSRITVMRPMVGTEDNKMGALPGTLEEKIEPWMIPIRENMYMLYDKEKIDKMFREGIIRTLPLQYCQGVTFTDEVVLIDEAQNATAQQFEMILTRLGRGSKMIFTGDPNQIQLKVKSHSGFSRLIDISKEIDAMECVHLTENYRDPIVREIIEKYNK